MTKRGEKNIWNRIGTAFPTKDGKGYRLVLELTPVKHTCVIVLLPPEDKPHGDEGQ